MPQWLSTHPNTENRITDISAEIDRLGGPPQNATTDSAEFRSIQKYVKTLPRPKEVSAAKPQGTAKTTTQRPPIPSERVREYATDILQLRYPENWTVYGSEPSVTLAPENGIISGNQGDSVAYGLMISVFAPQAGQSGRFDLQEATDQLIDTLKKQNPQISVSRSSVQRRVGGERALSTTLRNDSPLGGKETNWLVTVLRPEGLIYFVGVAPEKEYGDYQRAFENLINSVGFISK